MSEHILDPDAWMHDYVFLDEETTGSQPDRVNSPMHEGVHGLEALGYPQLDIKYLHSKTLTGSSSNRQTYENFKFESGCRLVGPEQIEKSDDRSSNEPPDENAIKCEHPDCASSKKTFGRLYELNRHMQKHLKPRSFVCMAVSCLQEKTKGFNRVDNLHNHMRSQHTIDEPFLCPQDKCEVGPLPLDLMGVHARSHRGYAIPVNSRVEDHREPRMKGLSSFSDYGRKLVCPLDGCGKYIDNWRLASHISSHNYAEQQHQQDVLKENGYTVQGLIICPLCQGHVRGSFGHHLTEDHQFPSLYWEREVPSTVFEAAYQHRRAILRLYPYSERCSIFDDLRPKKSAS